jgi:uncharacterized ubiquitin-like protein YukD
MNVILKFFLTLIFAQLIFGTLSSQSVNQLEFRTGLILFDSKVAEGDILESAKGWGSQADLTFFRTFDINRRFKPTIGLGYTNFYYWNVDLFDKLPQVLEPPYSYDLHDGDKTSHYMNVKYGIDVAFNNKMFDLTLMASHYLLLHKELQGINQRRNFMNIEVGFKYHLNQKYTLAVSTPFTIHPIVQDRIIRVLSAGNTPQFERFVEMNGILIGIRYNFYK